VVRPFARPSSEYGQGHRGVDLGGQASEDVRAVDAGTVSHVGVIAGRGTVTVLHPSGVSSTYEPVSADVTVGQVVARGERLGALDGAGSHCAPRVCLHLGAVRDRTYLDPMALLGARPVRLLPLQPVP
jgi:murein DD-endopeptidase MepM/ murein hydrolase activator NlpD